MSFSAHGKHAGNENAPPGTPTATQQAVRHSLKHTPLAMSHTVLSSMQASRTSSDFSALHVRELPSPVRQPQEHAAQRKQQHESATAQLEPCSVQASQISNATRLDAPEHQLLQSAQWEQPAAHLGPCHSPEHTPSRNTRAQAQPCTPSCAADSATCARLDGSCQMVLAEESYAPNAASHVGAPDAAGCPSADNGARASARQLPADARANQTAAASCRHSASDATDTEATALHHLYARQHAFTSPPDPDGLQHRSPCRSAAHSCADTVDIPKDSPCSTAAPSCADRPQADGSAVELRPDASNAYSTDALGSMFSVAASDCGSALANMEVSPLGDLPSEGQLTPVSTVAELALVGSDVPMRDMPEQSGGSAAQDAAACASLDPAAITPNAPSDACASTVVGTEVCSSHCASAAIPTTEPASSRRSSRVSPSLSPATLGLLGMLHGGGNVQLRSAGAGVSIIWTLYQVQALRTFCSDMLLLLPCWWYAWLSFNKVSTIRVG